MTQAETACPDVWGSHFLEYRGRLLALARKNLNPVLARRVSAEEALLAACGKMAFFENNPEIPVYFKLRMILFQTLTAMERKHLQCLKRDACREVNVTDDSVGSAARLDWNRFADTVTGPLTRAVRADRYTLLRKAVEALPENDRQILMCAMRKQQLPGAKTIVLQEDPAAFMIVTSASQVLGKGYKSLDEEEL